MALNVIGSGLGRTGTKSLQTALNILGLGPCHHMAEVFMHPESMALWIEAGNGGPRWDAIFANYHCAVDYPSAAYWRELTLRYLDAKVLHTTRDPEAWFESTQATIFAPDGVAVQAIRSGEGLAAAFFASFTEPFKDRLNDRAFLIDYFQRHHEEVMATIPAERLLVYEAGQGWEPLCEFLGVSLPAEPYPFENSRAEFIGRGASLPVGAGLSPGDKRA
jgi:Sulfotransferase domain